MSNKELLKILQEEVYPKLTQETVDALVLLGDDYDRHEWNFYVALYQYLMALQMKDEACQGAMVLVKRFVQLIGLDWGPFVKAASLAIRNSDPRLKTLGHTTDEGQK